MNGFKLPCENTSRAFSNPKEKPRKPSLLDVTSFLLSCVTSSTKEPILTPTIEKGTTRHHKIAAREADDPKLDLDKHASNGWHSTPFRGTTKTHLLFRKNNTTTDAAFGTTASLRFVAGPHPSLVRLSQTEHPPRQVLDGKRTALGVLDEGGQRRVLSHPPLYSLLSRHVRRREGQTEVSLVRHAVGARV